MKTLELGIAALAACICARAQSVESPKVVLGDIGTVVGVTNSTFGFDSFRGIPYAQPPLGQLRWRKSVPLTSDPSRVIQATDWGPACIQVLFLQQLPPGFTPYATSEDCLFINIFRPSGLNSTTKLPVLVWIHGGAFVIGAPQLYDPTFLVAKSIQMGEPIIYASMTYRLNAFGFLASKELAAAQKYGSGTLNAGLYDIQSALLWVQKHIGKFGGDPTKVTVFGESAGATAIGSLLVAGGGKAVQNLKLFRGAIMESGAPSGDGVPAPSYFDSSYRDFASLVGCGSALSNGTSLQCLRGASTDILANASQAILPPGSLTLPYNRVQDGYFHDKLPSAQVRGGRVANVPLMMGTNLDEGTLFANTNLNSDSDLVNWITTYGGLYDKDASPAFNATIIPKLLQLYPDDPTVGSPYNPVGTSKSDRFYGPTNQYKRIASILGDTLFNAGRRLLLNAYIKKSYRYPLYNYHFTQNTSFLPPAYGVWHFTETFFVYGLYAPLFPNNTVGAAVSNYMSAAWIAFANNLQPNRPNLPKWPTYGQKGATLRIGTDAPDYSFTRVITDDFRDEPIAFLGSEVWSEEVNF